MKQLVIIGIIIFIIGIWIYLNAFFVKKSDVYSSSFENFYPKEYLDFSLSNLNMDISTSNIPYYKTVSYEILTDYKLNSPHILPLTKYDTCYNSYYYDTNNYDVQYHSIYNNKLETTGIWVKNPNGKLEYIEWTEVPKYSTYYQPNTLKYGPSNYVPSYEDTVYLKKYTNKKKVVYQK